MQPDKTQPVQKKSKKKAVKTGFTIALLLICAFLVFFKLNFVIVEVRGSSMDPTFHEGERLLVCKALWLVGPIVDNDIVVAYGPDDIVIKRVYATGGESVDFYYAPDSHSFLQGEYVVPKNHYYLLGDNRLVSEDSRSYGPIPSDRIMGKVVAIELGFSAPVEADQE